MPHLHSRGLAFHWTHLQLPSLSVDPFQAHIRTCDHTMHRPCIFRWIDNTIYPWSSIQKPDYAWIDEYCALYVRRGAHEEGYLGSGAAQCEIDLGEFVLLVMAPCRLAEVARTMVVFTLDIARMLRSETTIGVTLEPKLACLSAADSRPDVFLT